MVARTTTVGMEGHAVKDQAVTSTAPAPLVTMATSVNTVRYPTVLYIKRYVQWNLFNPDTNGAEESVIVSEVSSFQRLSKSGTWSGKRCPVLERCPQFRSVLIEREVPLYTIALYIAEMICYHHNQWHLLTLSNKYSQYTH